MNFKHAFNFVRVFDQNNSLKNPNENFIRHQDLYYQEHATLRFDSLHHSVQLFREDERSREKTVMFLCQGT